MTTTFYDHWRDVPEGSWRWPNFSPAEIACRGTGKLLINEPALDRLQALRDRLGKPLIVVSAYRSPEHNRAVGGATRSKHMEGAAFDISMANHDPAAFEAAAREVGFLGFGFYPRSGFMHVDLGPARQWGERFPVRATAFAAETPPAREVLADSRTMKGGGAAGVATLGAAGVEVAQSVLAETGAELLFEMISQRYERGATLITSNLPFDEWTETFGTERLTGALLDRLTHHVNILEMNGESYRLAQSRARKPGDNT